MRQRVLLLSIFLMAVVAGISAADDSNGAVDNQQLRRRIEKLEKELQELKKLVAEKDDAKPSEPLPETPPETPRLAQSDIEKIAAMVKEDAGNKKPVWSNLDIQIYGYLKLDAAYDSSRTDTGNYARWVDPENTGDNDNQFNMTANQSRLGLLINGPENGSIKASGRAEVDFYGGGSENKSHLMMRHAYIKLDWPEEKFNIIAGQTSDVISPLFPSTVNYTVGWWTGNIGYRRPQVRLTKDIPLGDSAALRFEGAVARTIGRNNMLSPSSESGEDSGIPSLQARASVTIPMLQAGPTTLGVSGHWGEEEYDTAASEKEFHSWSLNLDFTQPVTDWLTIKSELFTGENLDAYLGGIGQGVITDTTKVNFYEEIGSTGGWIAASLGPWDRMQFNIGAGMDDVRAGNVNAGDRTMNRSVFGNVIYSAGKNTEVGFELSHWRTEYHGKGDGDSLRAQTSLMYKF